MVEGRSVLVGVTGSVAAYKSIGLVKQLRDEGASVKVIMTEASRRFLTPLSLELASGNRVYQDMFEWPLSHIQLPQSAHVFVLAPATANIIGKYAYGIADDLLSTSLLACTGKVVIAPAMNWRMWENPIVQRNVAYLLSCGATVVGPERGSLACGEEGIGKMAEVEKILEAIRKVLTLQDFEGEHVVVTAGPTREYIDPVRFLSNRSSGKMGYAIAKIARRRGARVTLISGPVSLKPPDEVTVVNVETALEMHRAVMEAVSSSSVVIMSAAVADFMPAAKSDHKAEKKERIILELRKTRDILRETGHLKGRPFIVGFSAETGDLLERARKKLYEKKADMIVFNDVTKQGAGFDVSTNKVVLIDRAQERELPLMSKEEVATALLDRVMELKAEGSG